MATTYPEKFRRSDSEDLRIFSKSDEAEYGHDPIRILVSC
jgi:hypothetical protein